VHAADHAAGAARAWCAGRRGGPAVHHGHPRRRARRCCPGAFRLPRVSAVSTARVPAPLRQRDFRRLWVAGLISDSGDWLLLVSLPILVYELTGSALRTSFAFLIELVPAVLLAPVSGYLADRWNRRRLLVTVALAQAVALLPLLTVHDRRDLPVLYAVIAV